MVVPRQHFFDSGCKMGAGVIQMNFQEEKLLRYVCIGLLPLLILLTVVTLGRRSDISSKPVEQENPTSPAPNQPEEITISVIYGNKCERMELERYLLGVVLAEMPASFETQALCAQAVAARTYTMKHCMDDRRHGLNTICSNSTCCQAYIDPQDFIAAGGSWNDVDRVEMAVNATGGQVLVYQGKLIEATYFSCAGGLTEGAIDVWGQDVPYLQSVPSPGEEQAAYFIDSKSFTAQQLQTALGIHLKGKPSSWFGEVTFTAGGGVNSMEIGEVAYRGTTLRQLLQLRSTAFTVSFQGDVITFHTRGFGHRVGMSQYGANAMAEGQKTYAEILSHYYCGTEIVQYCDFYARNSKSFG